MSKDPKSPAKRRQSPAGPQAKSTRTLRSQGARQQETASKQPEPPQKEKEECKVCRKQFELLFSHLKRSKPCAAQYDMPAMEEMNKKRLKESKRVSSAERHKKHREEINAAKTKTPDAKEKNRAASLRYYHKNKDTILPKMARQRKVKFDNKTVYDRFMDFKNAMKNAQAYGCICCHTILSTTKDCRVSGGLKGLEKELGTDLFKSCILDKSKGEELPKELTNAEDIYLCITCRRWLKEYKEMPPKCHKNGLGVDPIPPGLQELDDLGMLLISKSILFIKLYNMAVSRWYSSKDHAVHVPIDDDTLLKTYQQATSFPRLPEEAGVVAIDFKRKQEYKNSHQQFYVQPKLLMHGLQELIEGHPSYKNIKINDRYQIPPEDMPDLNNISEMEEEDDTDDEDDEDDEDDAMDSVMRNQFSQGGSTMMVKANLQKDVITNLPKGYVDPKEQRVTVAPGEGKVPTNLTRDKNWDIDSLPKLHPRGRFGIHHPRNPSQRKNLTVQDYVCQRLQNVDPRWRKCPTALFSYLYCIERLGLEKAKNIAYRRGMVGKDGKLTNLENATTMFKNQPGTDQYWQTKRYEVLAKVEQLGPFQIFFTLSCADKRWDENFVAILQQRGLKIHYRPSKEQPDTSGKYSFQADDVFVEENGVDIPLDDYLNDKKFDLHKTVKENVLTITMMFDKRVKEFINKIVMAPSNPMRVKYYHYRVEFQKRGAAHIHGVLWLDLELLESTFKGLTSAMLKFKTQETLSKEEKAVVASFVDSCSTCGEIEKSSREIEKSSREVEKSSR